MGYGNFGITGAARRKTTQAKHAHSGKLVHDATTRRVPASRERWNVLADPVFYPKTAASTLPIARSPAAETARLDPRLTSDFAAHFPRNPIAAALAQHPRP